MKTVTFKPGDIILSEGEAGDTAFLVVSGTVEVTVGTGRNARTVGRFGAGEVFGEMSLIEPGKRTATVKALTDTECVETTYEQFAASLEHNPQAALQFMKMLVRRIRHMNELMTTMDSRKRTLRAVFHDWQGPTEILETGTRAAAEQQATSRRNARMI